MSKNQFTLLATQEKPLPSLYITHNHFYYAAAKTSHQAWQKLYTLHASHYKTKAMQLNEEFTLKEEFTLI
jgi:hypothetical protein